MATPTGNTNPTYLVNPFAIPTTQLKNIVFASASHSFSIFIDSSGNVYASGQNTNNIFQQSSVPTYCQTACLVGYAQLKNSTISACVALAHIVFLTSKGSVYTIGLNNNGELGR